MTLKFVKTNPEEEFKDSSLLTVPEEMQACTFYGPGDIRYEKIKTPEVKQNEILVKVKAALTCGTDLKTFQRGHPLLIKSTPSTFGHQFSGVVAKVGENVNKFSIGDKVIALNSSPCFECVYCNKEKFSLCENISFLNGAYAEYILVPERIVKHNTYHIPPGASFISAAITESLAVVLHGLHRSEIEGGKTVCILGTGSIGLLFAALAKKNGARVISVGRKEHKLKLAKWLGADHAFLMEDENELIKKINALTDGYGPEVVVEAIGTPETWELATKLVGKGGLVNFFGGCKKGTKVELDTYKIHYEELKLLGIFHHTPKHTKEAIELLSDENFRKTVLKGIISGVMPLSKLKDAFYLHENGEAIQIAIKPEPD